MADLDLLRERAATWLRLVQEPGPIDPLHGMHDDADCIAAAESIIRDFLADEPEYMYAVSMPYGHDLTIDSDQPTILAHRYATHRQRKAGPWERLPADSTIEADSIVYGPLP